MPRKLQMALQLLQEMPSPRPEGYCLWHIWWEQQHRFPDSCELCVDPNCETLTSGMLWTAMATATNPPSTGSLRADIKVTMPSGKLCSAIPIAVTIPKRWRWSCSSAGVFFPSSREVASSSSLSKTWLALYSKWRNGAYHCLLHEPRGLSLSLVGRHFLAHLSEIVHPLVCELECRWRQW